MPRNDQTPLLYHKSSDIEERNNFSTDVPISKASFKNILAEYEGLSPMVPCQLSDGSALCGTLHGNGFIAETIEGREGYLGGCCAKAKFGDHLGFKKNLSVFRAKAARAALFAELDEFNSDYPNAVSYFDELLNRLVDLRETVFNPDRGLAVKVKPILAEIVRRARSDSMRVYVNLLYDEVDEDGNVEWVSVEHVVGQVRFKKIWLRESYAPIKKEIVDAIDAWDGLRDPAALTNRQLRTKLNAIKALSHVEFQLNQMESDIRTCDLKGICSSLVYMTMNVNQRIYLVQHCYQVGLSIKKAKALLDGWDRELKDSTQAKKIQVA